MKTIFLDYWEKNYHPERKNCLMILPRPVFPLISGYSNKNSHLIRGLSERYNLSLVVILEKELPAEEAEFYETGVCRAACFYLGNRKKYLGALGSLWSDRPLQSGYYYHRAIRDTVKSWAGDADFVVASLVRTVRYLEDIPDTKVRVFDIVDSIGQNYIRSVGKTASLFWKACYRLEGGRLLRYEKKWVHKADISFFINEKERACYQSSGRTAWLPHGVKEELFSYDKCDPRYGKYVAFIGKMDYQPNIDAVIWYAANVHPHVEGEHPLLIIGANPVREIRRLGEEQKNITVTGYCEDPYFYLNSAMAVIAPMQTGGGIQNKVLESMALGKVTIVSRLAAEPILGAADGIHFLLADSPAEYVEAIQKVSEKPERYRKMGREARNFIRSHFTWERYIEGYVREMEEISVHGKRDQT